MRVLIADDSRAMRDALRALVNELGSEVVGEARNGVEALEIFGRLQPDLVLLDISMPIMGGFRAAVLLRLRRPSLSIIFVTQQSGVLFADKAFLCGACGYVVKRGAARELAGAFEALKTGLLFRSPLIAA